MSVSVSVSVSVGVSTATLSGSFLWLRRSHQFGRDALIVSNNNDEQLAASVLRTTTVSGQFAYSKEVLSCSVRIIEACAQRSHNLIVWEA